MERRRCLLGMNSRTPPHWAVLPSARTVPVAWRRTRTSWQVCTDWCSPGGTLAGRTCTQPPLPPSPPTHPPTLIGGGRPHGEGTARGRAGVVDMHRSEGFQASASARRGAGTSGRGCAAVLAHLARPAGQPTRVQRPVTCAHSTCRRRGRYQPVYGGATSQCVSPRRLLANTGGRRCPAWGGLKGGRAWSWRATTHAAPSRRATHRATSISV